MPRFVHYWEAFQILSAARVPGLPIAVSEIAAYCEMIGISTIGQKHDLLTVLQEVDATFLQDVRLD